MSHAVKKKNMNQCELTIRQVGFYCRFATIWSGHPQVWASGHLLLSIYLLVLC
jgi:hypothetical protein